jgi:TM2 domain-containing membrane protein YozV
MVYCTNCGQNIRSNNMRYCTSCGSPQSNYQNSSTMTQNKNQRTVVLMALIVGFLGFEGIGHLYIGKTRRGITLLLIGWGLSISTALTSSIGLLSVTVLIGISFFAFWIWQTYDANKLAKQHNEFVIQN